MAAGIPAVASAVGANLDIVTDSENGFLARSNEDWVRLIATLLDDAVLRRKFALRGRQLVEHHFSLDQFSDRYIKLMREVCEQGR
jgi:glycosyltransferase involved in cell wall biosynthesis